jgi:uncharacterized membrane protein
MLRNNEINNMRPYIYATNAFLGPFMLSFNTLVSQSVDADENAFPVFRTVLFSSTHGYTAILFATQTLPSTYGFQIT